MMSETTILSIATLHDRVEAIFRKAGLNAIQAGAVARVIVAGERDHCKSHGIYRIEGALRTVKAGKVKADAIPEIVTEEASSIVRVNANYGFANPAFEMGVPVLAERARRNGIAALVINDCTHFSALWPEVEALTAEGLAALVMCPSYATVAPTGGNKPLLGTNLSHLVGRARQHHLTSSTLQHPLPHVARSNCIAAQASSCRKAGHWMPTATRRQIRKQHWLVPCCHLAGIKVRQSAQWLSYSLPS